MSLKEKILIGYLAAFVLMGLVAASAVTNLISLGKVTNAILRENYRSILAAENMLDALERQDRGILIMFLGAGKKGIDQFRESKKLFLEWLARAKDNITIQGEAELVQSIESDYSKYHQQFFRLTDLGGKVQALPQSSLTVYQESAYPLLAKVRKECIELRRLNEETMYAAGVRARNAAKRAVWSTVLVSASALIVALIVSLFLAEANRHS